MGTHIATTEPADPTFEYMAGQIDAKFIELFALVSGIEIDESGNTAGRATYDAESKGFWYYDSEAGFFYQKQSATSGDWSDGVLVPTGAIIGGVGGVANAVPRADGTGGVTLKASALIIDDSGNVTGARKINGHSAILGDAGTLDPAVLGANFNVDSDASSDGGDWTAWIRRQGSAANNENLFRLEHFSATETPHPVIAGIANRGTVASKIGLSADDFLLILDGRGFDGSAVNHGEYAVGVSDSAAQIAFRASEAWSSTAHGSYITFSTVGDGTVSVAERMRIHPAGQITIGHSSITGVGAGDISLLNDRALRARNSANTASILMIQLTSSNNVQIGDGTGSIIMSSSDLGIGRTISAGANDSAGSGFRTLRVPNA